MDSTTTSDTLSHKQIHESFPKLRHPGGVNERVHAGIREGKDDEASVERTEEMADRNDAEVEDQESKLIRCPADDEGDDDDEEHLKNNALRLAER